MKSTLTPYENLANAIILKAVEDYRKVLQRQKQAPEQESVRAEKQSIEQFFLSDWFSILTTLNPEMLIHRLSQEVA